MKSKNVFVYLFILLFISIGLQYIYSQDDQSIDNPCIKYKKFNMQLQWEGTYKKLDKSIIQKNTFLLLDRYDRMPNKYKSLNTLYSDQSYNNISRYEELYKETKCLLYQLRKGKNYWHKLIAQNPNDKVYHVFAGLIETTMYAIYSQPDKYISFFKIKNDSEKYNYENELNLWKYNADDILAFAKMNLKKALQLDQYYYDAKILMAQLLVLEGDFDAAEQAFERLNNDKAFKQKRALLESWRAFIAFKKNDSSFKEKLGRAAASTEPFVNSQWARKFRYNIDLSKKYWTEFKFHPLEQIENLEQLQNDANKAIFRARKLLRSFIEKIPESLNKESHKRLVKSSKTNSDILLSPSSDKSEENIAKFKKFIKELHGDGKILRESIKKWDNIIDNNPKIMYFRLNRARVSMNLLYIIKITKTVVNHIVLKKRLGQTIVSDWSKWESEIKSNLDIDIANIKDDDPIIAQFLSFEYKAFFLPSAEAQLALIELEKKLKKMKLKKIKIDSLLSIDIKAYVASWKSFLEIKGGANLAAKESLEKLKKFNEFYNWSKIQKNILHLEKFYLQNR
nr:hypothetical protein 12 [Candidatus Aminicenantes bacterium]